MSFNYEQKASASRFVERIWRSEDITDGVYIAAADGCWDLVFITSQAKTTVLLSGPSSKTTEVPYKAGNTNFGIKFREGTFLTHVPVSAMVDVVETLETPSSNTFVLARITWQMPDYNTADTFVAQLEERNLLSDDPWVRANLLGQPVAASDRSMQRHFAHATGLTPHRVKQIMRARRAVDLLKKGAPITTVVTELGYADQAHMTRDIKRLTGYTPRQNKVRDEPI